MVLPLDPIVQVTYNLPGVGSSFPSFNLGLIVGNSTVISPTTRTVLFSSTAEMVTAGFSTSSPEYLAAVVYFEQYSQPTQVVIGRQNVSESMVAAVTACRASNTDWYMCVCPQAVDADHSAIAAYIESVQSPKSQYIFQTSTAAIAAGTGGNLFLTLQTAKYSRTQGIFSTSANLAVGVEGFAMGQTSNRAKSAFNLNCKVVVGGVAEALTTAQVTAIKGANGNVYVERLKGNPWYESGQMFSGAWFDEISGIDQLVSNIQISIANQLYTTNKEPQTDEGLAELFAVIAQACKKAVTTGFIAPGVWNGATILGLTTGDVLQQGFLIQADSLAAQSEADRTARKAPNIYVAIKLAGAIQSVVVELDINR